MTKCEEENSTLPTQEIHPPIHNILDALSFRMARFVAVNDLTGSTVFKAQYGLSLNEWRVLGLSHALSPATFSRIRSLLIMDKGQLSRIVKSLTEAGLLTTNPAKEDARAIVIALTPSGRKLHDEVLNFTAHRNAITVAPLTAQECAEFMRILTKMTAHKEALSELSGLLK